jgi:prophage antirepressor-like protein
MVKTVDNNEKMLLVPTTDSVVGTEFQANTPYTFLTEDGLYEVLMLSRLPKAKELKKEIKQVLKAIRKKPKSRISTPTALSLGKQTSKICKQKNIEVGKVNDARYGQVNTYPDEILYDIFKASGLIL